MIDAFDKGRIRAWIEINTDNLRHNIREIKRLTKDKSKVMAVVKANAYGHGMVKTSKVLNDAGIDFFAVATLDEAITLRKNGIKGQILILGYTDLSCVNLIRKYDLIQTVVDFEYALKLNSAIKEKIKIHIKIDTGMSRLGIKFDDFNSIIEVFKLNYLKVTGIYTHLCCSDSLEEKDVCFSKEQIRRFNNCVSYVKEMGFNPGNLHVQGSYGIINYDDFNYDYVRPGIIMYGVNENLNMKLKNKIDLRPVLELKAKISSVRLVKAGEYVGYSRSFKAMHDIKVATVSIGYADGYKRSLSNKHAKTFINDKTCEIIGNICMDQMMVDVTKAGDVKQGDIVKLIGTEDEIRIEYLSNLAGTISHEFLSNLGLRLKRIIK